MSPSVPLAELAPTERRANGRVALVLRRLDGPLAREVYLSARPVEASENATEQAEAIYRSFAEALEAVGGSLASIVAETVHLRDVSRDGAAITSLRARLLAGDSARHAAVSVVGQPPLDAGAQLALTARAVLPTAAGEDPTRARPTSAEVVAAPRATCDCAHCASGYAVRLELGPERQLHAAGICGAGADAHAQTLAMFARAEAMLEAAGMDFRDVVRTWIHLREIDRDYAALNTARRAFFTQRSLDPPPASTGIGGAPIAPGHDLCLAFQAVRGGGSARRSAMRAPTLNEAPRYGADFVRGMRVVEANKEALYVSGTASIDEAGRTAHPGDLEAQAKRMLRNVSALLDGQGAGFRDIASAITYLRHPADAGRLRSVYRECGYEGFPHVLVEAPVCRPDLLCETEVIAVRPRRPERIGTPA